MPRPIPSVTFLGTLGLGAALMYYLDPQGGRQRRARLRSRYEQAVHRIEHAGDMILAARVRAALRQQVSHPHAIEVQSHEGAVTLSGAILAHEIEGLLDCVRGLHGVKAVESELIPHEDPARLEPPRGVDERAKQLAQLVRENWPPSARAAAGGLGALLALNGLLRGGVKGLAYGAIGSTLLARAATHADLKGIVSGSRAKKEDDVSRPEPWRETDDPELDAGARRAIIAPESPPPGTPRH